MDQSWDVQRDHVGLIRAACSLLAPGGEMFFSTNRRGFRLDNAALADIDIEDITASSFDPDFARNQRIHKLYLIHEQNVAVS